MITRHQFTLQLITDSTVIPVQEQLGAAYTLFLLQDQEEKPVVRISANLTPPGSPLLLPVDLTWLRK